MSITVKSKYIVGLILILFVALFIGGWYMGVRKERKARTTELNALKFELSKKTIELNKKTVYLTQTEQALATEKELVRAGIVES
jgi:cbb3-type cytochrome oxidase subunit 3